MTKWMPACLLVVLLAGRAVAADEPNVSFRAEVMAVLSRAGCNRGACHGNLNGKGGFKLSLRGQNPAFDHAALTRDQLGRRIDRQDAERSLILYKATARLPHEGGPRFAVGSLEYTLLRRWIEQGSRLDAVLSPRLTRLDVTPSDAVVSPGQTVAVQATAVFADGRRKNIGPLAVYESTNPAIEVGRDGTLHSEQPGETTVVARYLEQQATARIAFVPERADYRWSDPPAVNFIDTHVYARLQKLRMNPSDLCSDSEFLRRATLDLLGLLPTSAEVRRFLADDRPDKRARLVEELLGRPEFVDCWALKWSDLLRNEERTLDTKGVRVYHDWIKRQLAAERPLNEMARDLIASRGSTYRAPAANYYRALRDPQTRAEATAQVFLGIRMQCAKCHNHPFDRWTQDDYHRLAAFFARVGYKIVENKRRDKLDSHEFAGEQIVTIERVGEVEHPTTGAVLKPRFLGGAEAAGDGDRLEALADWVAQPDNPFFARTQANRVWSYLFGRGIVEPNDDFRVSNPPVNRPLLDALARELAEHRFDLKHLIRTIAASRTYQLSATPNATNADDATNFSHVWVRPLTAEPLLDALSQATGVPIAFDGYPLGLRAGQLPSLPMVRRNRASAPGVQFLRLFGKPERLLSCDCERATDTTLAQALQLITGPLLNDALRQPDNRLGTLLQAEPSNRAVVEELVLTCLSRPPTERERSELTALIERGTDRRAACEDVLWALVNAKEFLLRK